MMKKAKPDDRTALLRDQAYTAVRAAMPTANMEAARVCGDRLAAALPHDQLDLNQVLVMCGGGKDSSYTLAFVRAMQLILYRAHGRTFRLRAATNRHAGMPRAVLANVERAYQALRLVADPDCELLLIDGNEVRLFDVDAPQHPAVLRRNRVDILMTGHRTFADGRPTFCNACNLSVFNSFGVAAAYGAGADLIITGDSPREQRQYIAWLSKLARRLAPATALPAAGPAAAPDGRNGPGRVLSHLDRIGQSYFADIHGPEATEALAERRVTSAVPAQLQFFSIYGDTAYTARDHLEMLTGFLGFEFDDFAFSFTESDCGNPALMAHLRGLKCERVYQRSYADGLEEYVAFALDLMRQKDFPPSLIEQMRERYSGPGAIEAKRRAADEYAMATFGLDEIQLVCLVYSPFAQKGAGLEEFLQREHPALAGQAPQLRALLGGEAGADLALAGPLREISGLELSQLRVLYRSSLRRGDGAVTDVIETILADDPHKAIIATRHSPNGPTTLELISGR